MSTLALRTKNFTDAFPAGGRRVLQKKNSRTLAITRFTEINVNGRGATVVDLKRGMRVSVIAGTDPTQAARINANG